MSKRFKITLTIIASLFGLSVVAVLAYFFTFLISAREDINIPLQETPVTYLSTSTFIPGLTVENVKSTLVNNNLVCNEKEEIYKNIYYRTSCEQVTPDYAFTVHIFSSNQANINLIDANFTQLNNPSNEQTLNFFEIITQLPIEGIDANRINTWMKIALTELDKKPGSIKDNTLNRLYFRIYGTPNDRSLEIGKID